MIEILVYQRVAGVVQFDDRPAASRFSGLG